MAYENQLVLNEIISEKQSEIEQLKEQNRLLIKRICQLQSDLSKEKSLNDKLKACYNCKAELCKSCKDFCNWIFVGDK
jgi:uncharacterized protein YigA (DUF484 family)